MGNFKPQIRDLKVTRAMSQAYLLTVQAGLLLNDFRKKASDLRMRGELTTKSYKRSRAYAFVLLCLMAHALFVCFTHHHNARPDLPSSATASISATGNSDSENSTDSGSDAHCLSCRLQRNLISDHPAASLVIALIPEALSREARFAQLHTQRFFVSFFGRAPPTA